MIVVRNTKELEERYNLHSLPDNETVLVKGGLDGKTKYNADRYRMRTTYTGRQIKQIVGQMKQIEDTIPNNWNQWQKAKYIYEVLGKNIDYNFNKEEYKTQQPSNLSIILSRKGICAGYALLYKEMMDRQGINCDYMRGKATNSSGHTEQHAWNVLNIGGHSVPVDLTWDSPRLIKGEDLKFFGTDMEFEQRHRQDADEVPYNFTYFTKDTMKSINTDRTLNRTEISEEQKLDVIHLAIEETYNKFKDIYGEEKAKVQVKEAIKKYIIQGNINGFTRQGNARRELQQFIKPEDMLNSLISSYVDKSSQPSVDMPNSVLDNAIYINSNVYNTKQSELALKKYFTEGYTKGFTRQNNVRATFENNISPRNALDMMVNGIVEREISEIDKSETIRIDNIQQAQKMYFEGDEFALLPPENKKDKNIITKAMDWIKQKMNEMKLNKNRQNSEPQRSQTQTKDEENYR